MWAKFVKALYNQIMQNKYVLGEPRRVEIKFTDLFQKLLECKWLENCGSDIDANYDFKTMLVTKEKAEKRIVSIKWQNTCLNAENDLTEYLYLNHRDEYNLFWNKQVKNITEEYYPQIERLIRTKAMKKGLSEEVLIDVKGNFISIMMAHFYSEYFESEFWKRF